MAERSGVPATTLRYYDSAGLLPAERTPSGYRLYDARSLERLEFISSAKFLGLSLEEIGELLTVWEQGVCGSVRSRLLPLVQGRIAEADRRIAELAAFSAHLKAVHGELSGPPPEGACAPGCGCVGPPAGPVAVDLLATRPEGEGQSPAGGREDVPVACTLSGGGQAQRVTEWQTLVSSATGREAVPNGLRLFFPAEAALAGALARLATAESDCCRFFDFALEFGADALVFTVRAPAGTEDLLVDLFGEAA